MKRIFVILFSCFLISCDSDNGGTGEITTPVGSTPNEKKQLNISILLDLSDRIDPAKNQAKPEHHERDVAIIKQLATYFKNDMESKGSHLSKGKIKVFFSPNPEEPEINSFAQKLDVDLSKMDVKQKKDVYNNIEGTFEESARNIYQVALKQGKWNGADIWRFFKNDVKDYCISPDENYRNILVILTDGYLFHSDSKNKVNNRTSYITPVLFNEEGFRKNNNWKERFKTEDYGLITERKDLQNLEVLVLEVDPSKVDKNDEDLIREYLYKWFSEMEVKKAKVYNSDLPENTKKRLEDFLAS